VNNAGILLDDDKEILTTTRRYSRPRCARTHSARCWCRRRS
jgi:hypothetical protein